VKRKSEKERERERERERKKREEIFQTYYQQQFYQSYIERLGLWVLELVQQLEMKAKKKRSKKKIKINKK